MEDMILRRILVLGVMVLLIGVSIVPIIGGSAKDSFELASFNPYSKDRDTEYWALIFAVGVYKNHEKENRPAMLESADNLYEVLLNSPNWKADHIHLVKGANATGRRLIKELIWLIKNEDSNDMSLVYLTTHGSPLRTSILHLPIDLPPIDEKDRADEILVMYNGFNKWYAFIWDDLLNFFLSLLQSKGVCLIVESCYSGGFNDDPMFSKATFNENNAESFAQGFAEELSAQNRIVLMCCEENEPSYGCYFSEFLIEGLWGIADTWGNKDGIISAEEGFDYAKYWVNENCYFNPTILDLYPGEYTITFS